MDSACSPPAKRCPTFLHTDGQVEYCGAGDGEPLDSACQSEPEIDLLQLEELLRLGHDNESSGSSDVDDTECASSVGASSADGPATPRRQPAKAAKKPRKKKKASAFLSAAERKKVIDLLSVEMKGSDHVDAIIGMAQSEKHFNFFPRRRESLAKDSSMWRELVMVMCNVYVDLFRECSTKADRFLKFQIQWNSAVNKHVLKLQAQAESVQQEKSDLFATAYALCDAAWVWCSQFIQKTLQAKENSPDHHQPAAQYTRVHVHRFFGAALHRFIGSLDRKVGRAIRAKKEPNAMDSDMLAILKGLRVKKDEKESSTLPRELLDTDRGGMTFLRPEFEEFGRVAIARVVSHVNKEAYIQFGKDMVKVAATALQYDKTVLPPFQDAVKRSLPSPHPRDEAVSAVGRELISKVLHAICEEVIDSCEQDQVLRSGSMTTKGQNLRDNIHVSNS